MLAVVALVASLAPPPLTLERIFSDPPLEGRAPMGLQLSPGGKYVTFLRPNEKDSDILDLWGAALPDAPGKAVPPPALLVATADLLGGGEQKLTEQERMALERKRISKRGITEYQWCGKDARALLFPFSGDLYLVKLAEGKPQVTRLTNDDGEPELNPTCTDDGTRVAFVKKGDVHVVDVATKLGRKISRGGGGTKTFGLAEFIAEEEMDRHTGMWWSPDNKTMLVLEVEEKDVGVKVRPQIFADRTELFEQRYPAAGEKNAVVVPWLIEVKTAKMLRVQAPTEDGYVPRAGFFDDNKPWIQWQSRDQKRLRLLEGNGNGVLRQILEETDDAWVDLHDDLKPLPNNKLLWSTERSGRRQLVVVDRATGALTPLTNEPEPVLRVLAVDDAKGIVFYSAARDRGRQVHAFAIPLAGGPTTQLTSAEGMHGATFDDDGRYFVDRASAPGVLPKTTLRDAKDGREVLVLDAPDQSELNAFGALEAQWLDVKADDGAVMNAVLYAPARRETGKRYPVIAMVYGGPTGHTVHKGWGRGALVVRHWTQRGFGVLSVDGRGMGLRDRAFARAHYQRFGDVELKDLVTTVEHVKGTVPWVDGAKIGVFGWSYGGYLSARAVLDDKTPFAAAAAVAPVTDWTLYDTHYTERYCGMPVVDGKPNGTYTSSNLVKRAAQLSRPLLLVHGTADDNVLFEHTLRLTEALQKEAKPFELMIYPGKAHGISGKPSQLHVYKTITGFFEEKLR